MILNRNNFSFLHPDSLMAGYYGALPNHLECGIDGRLCTREWYPRASSIASMYKKDELNYGYSSDPVSLLYSIYRFRLLVVHSFFYTIFNSNQ